jgi:hypothetical protein
VLQLTNHTGFAGTFFVVPNPDGVDAAYVVIKGTFALTAHGIRLAEEQLAPVLAPEYYGDPAVTSIRLPSDVSLMKPGTDVVLHGHAYAPDGHPAWQSDVNLTVAGLRRSVRVFGDRVWGVAGSIDWVAPFVRMPLVWERAYGGTDISDKGIVAEPRNPAGVGFRAKGTARPLAGTALPNIEDPTALISGPGDSPSPAGFASIAPHWQPRVSFAGSYDEAWQHSRAPYLPADFDPRFFQIAAPGLALTGYLQGGELVEVQGMSPNGVLSFHLPSTRVEATFVIDGIPIRHPAVLDCVLIDTEASRVSLVWRATQPCDKKVLRLNEIRATATAGAPIQ